MYGNIHEWYIPTWFKIFQTSSHVPDCINEYKKKKVTIQMTWKCLNQNETLTGAT